MSKKLSIVKHISCILTYAVLLTACLFFLSDYLTPKWIEGNVNNGNTYMTTTTDGFFALPENTVDIIFIGSSHVLRGVSPTVLSEEYGKNAYLRATVVQPPEASYYYLKNALKTQSPSTVIAEFYSLYDEYDYDKHEPYVRYAFDTMPFDLDKLTAICSVMKKTDGQNLLYYIFPSLYYHERWNELNEIDITYPGKKDKSDPNMGSILLDSVEIDPFTPYDGRSQNPEEYIEDSLYWYQKIIDLCKERGIRLIMLRAPLTDWNGDRYRADLDLAEKNDIELLDFNLDVNYEKADFDYRQDFVDKNHLSKAGAVKMTRAIGEYLENNK